MTSADFLQFVVTMLCFKYVYSFTPARPPRVSVTTFTSYICCIYTLKFGQYRTSFCVGNSSVSKRLLCSFCSSDRGFASDFFQTPPHDGRPCLWLTVPTAKPVADFHRQVITHAEHTTKNKNKQSYGCLFFILYAKYFIILTHAAVRSIPCVMQNWAMMYVSITEKYFPLRPPL